MLRNFLQKQISPIFTKLRVPHGRKAVQRKRLIHILNKGVRNELTLVSAPAGFGKTTLLIEWTRQSDLPVAWISLDKEDNDPLQFWIYLFSSIKILHPDIGDDALSLLQNSPSQSIEAILTLLINEVEQLTSQFVIVLDDYHIVTSPAIHQALIFLITHLPEQIRLIISSRTDPPFPLGRLRARGELTEIRAKNLRFTLDETVIFLKEIMKLDLSMNLSRTLYDSTEGWIAGLQIAALSIRSRDDIPEFVQTFSSSNRYLCDYLLEEVVENLPTDIQSFLFETSILEQLNAGLCDSVTNHTDSQAILEKLEKDNLFIIPMDDHRGWYRYHQLLVSSLRFRLNQKQPQKIPELFERAAIWYEENGYFVDSINSFFAASNFSQAARLINQIAIDMVYGGELGLVLSWLDRLPKEVLSNQPALLVYRAWSLISSELHLEVAEECLRQAESVLQDIESHAPPETGCQMTKSLRGAICYMYSFLARLKGNMQSAIIYAQDALRLLPVNDFIWRSGASWNLAEAYRYSGEVDQWGHALNEAITISRASEKLGAMLLAMDNLAELQVVQGQLYLAERTWNQALKHADERLDGKQSLIACTVYAGLGWLHYEWNNLDTAKNHLLTALELAKRGGIMEITLEGNISLARLMYQQGEGEAAIHLLHDLEPIIQTRAETKHAIRAKAYLAIWEYFLGNHEYFYNWVHTRQLSPDDKPVYSRESEYFILSRVMILEGRIEEVLRLLQRLQESGRASGRVLTEIKSLVLQAVALEQQGETAKAFILLERALSLAEPGGFVRTFIEASNFMFGLLNKYAARSPRQDYLNRLLSAYDGIVVQTSKVQSLVDPLSERELEVLRLVAARLSSREIANELNISINTARTHIKNIYSKLDAHNHSEAAIRAQAMGLLR